MLAELESWEQKKEVMKRKKNLEKERIVRIEDDLTKKRERNPGKAERYSKKKEKGDKVRIGYKKIF